jgi:hypothetical protein
MAAQLGATQRSAENRREEQSVAENTHTQSNAARLPNAEVRRLANEAACEQNRQHEKARARGRVAQEEREHALYGRQRMDSAHSGAEFVN